MACNPVFFEDVHPCSFRGWYFWDETWSRKHGPHASEAEANSALRRYAKSLEDRRSGDPTMTCRSHHDTLRALIGACNHFADVVSDSSAAEELNTAWLAFCDAIRDAEDFANPPNDSGGGQGGPPMTVVLDTRPVAPSPLNPLPAWLF